MMEKLLSGKFVWFLSVGPPYTAKEIELTLAVFIFAVLFLRALRS